MVCLSGPCIFKYLPQIVFYPKKKKIIFLHAFQKTLSRATQAQEFAHNCVVCGLHTGLFLTENLTPN